jgi:hypothetical protein
MKALTISESFRTAIGEREVIRAFFSTYSFEPDFFELEVLPLVLGNPALSSNETIRYYQLQSLMRQHVGRLAVVYDLDVFDPQLAPRLEVDYLPMRVGGACQHAKVIVLVVRERNSEQLSIVLGAGSFNLTKAGWWENLEVGHWVELHAGFAPRNILNPLLDALRFYKTQSPSPVFEAILDVAQSMEPTADEPSCAFYFSGSGKGRISFDEFISEQVNAKAPLEVISPFFAVEGDNQVILNLLKRFPSVTVLLPLDEHGQALVDRKAVYETLPNDTITWGRWSESIRKSHLDPKAGYRKLHAKIYQSLGDDPWVFVGSVNLSFKAFRQNVEAGFLLRGPASQSLLAPLQTPPDTFKVEPEAQGQSDSESQEMPAIHALFDWQSETIHLTSTKPGSLTFLSSASVVLLDVQLNDQKDRPVQAPQLKPHLQGSSLIDARWQSEGKNATGKVLISQRNIFCRPTHLPPFDLQALLRIFIGMHESRRLELFGDLAVRLLHASQEEGLQDEFLPELTYEGGFENFFAEFSQVNGAFWELADRLQKARQDGDSQTLAYYLHGQQPDSLRKLLETVTDAPGKQSPSLIVRYLTLLSVADLLKRFAEHSDASLLPVVETALLTLEQKELLTQLDGEKGKQFLRWFKAKFFEPVATMTCSSGEGDCFVKD